jgi:AcrR family transcriptional regulator
MTGTKQAKSKVDGRKQRSEKSRSAILAAIMELIEEGNLMPTAQETSERAGVGIRSVFRHFADMDALYAEMNVRGLKRFSLVFDAPVKEGSLEERLQHTVVLYHKGYQANKNMLMTTLLRRASSELLVKQYMDGAARLAEDFEQRIPEVANLKETSRHAIMVARSFTTYDHLRNLQGLSQKKTVEAVTEMITAIMKHA